MFEKFSWSCKVYICVNFISEIFALFETSEIIEFSERSGLFDISEITDCIRVYLNVNADFYSLFYLNELTSIDIL